MVHYYWFNTSLIFIFALILTTSNCMKKPAEESDEFKIRVNYWLWFGPDPLTAMKLDINVLVPVNSSFTKVMNKAAATANGFKYEFIQYDFGKYITSIGGYKENNETNIYWMIYKLPGVPDVNNPPPDSFLTPVGVDDIIVKHDDHYLFWLKLVNIESVTH